MSYGNYGQNPYQQGPATEGGYGQGQYEMQSYGEPAVLSLRDFLDRVQRIRDDIQGLTANVEQIGALHQRALGSTDGVASQALGDLVNQTQASNTRVKDAIKALERDVERTEDSSRGTKIAQLNSLKSTFQAELRRYQTIENEYQRRYKAQIMRQYRIVNPDATEEEVQEAARTDWGNEGVFQTAVCSECSNASSGGLVGHESELTSPRTASQ